MGLFSRRTPDLQPTGPFEFVVGDVFTITAVGHVLTGRVVSGWVTRGQRATVHLPGGPREVTVRRLESARRKREQVMAGAEAGLVLDGLEPGDIPTRPGGEHLVLDVEGLRGVRVVGTGV